MENPEEVICASNSPAEREVNPTTELGNNIVAETNDKDEQPIQPQQQDLALLNITKIETPSSCSDDNDMDDEDENSNQNPPNGDNLQMNGTQIGSNKGDQDPSARFQCRCGKQYSRNASLFNHIRIKHENKIHDWKIFDGMRKQGRPRKEVTASQQNPSLLPTQPLSTQQSEPVKQFLGNSTKEVLQSISNQNTDGKLNQSINNLLRDIGDSHQAHLNPLPFGQQDPPFGHPLQFSQDQFGRNLRDYPQSDFHQFDPNTSFLHPRRLEDPFSNLSMKIMIKFKEILIDSVEDRISESEEKQYLIKALFFQNSLFTKYQINYQKYQQKFESLYTFISYWIRYIKREEIEEMCREYLKFQFSKITQINIEPSPQMLKLTKIYEQAIQQQSQVMAQQDQLRGQNSLRHHLSFDPQNDITIPNNQPPQSYINPLQQHLLHPYSVQRNHSNNHLPYHHPHRQAILNYQQQQEQNQQIPPQHPSQFHSTGHSQYHYGQSMYPTINHHPVTAGTPSQPKSFLR